jgi:hypothetical protein
MLRQARSLFLAALLALPAYAPDTPGSSALHAQGPAECVDYASKLEACSPYTCTFRHPFTGAAMQRRVVGMEGDKCSYTEEMPNGGVMACSYPAEMRKSVAAFVRATQAAESTRTRARLGSDGSVTSSTTVDGRAVANPLDEALRTGVCTVKGYGNTATPARGAAAPGRAAAAPATAAPATRPATTAPPAAPATDPATATKAAAAALAPGTSAGTFTVGGKPFSLSHAYAISQPDRLDRTKTAVMVLLSDAPLTVKQAGDPRELQRLMRSNELHAVAVVIRDSNAVDSVLLYDAAFRSSVSVSVSGSLVKLDPGTVDGTLIGGQLSTVRPSTNSGVPFEFSAAFNAAIARP